MVDIARKYYPFDRNLAFSDGATLTATGNVQFNSADVILDLGAGRIDAVLRMNVTNVKVSAGNEGYTWLLQGSNTSDFSAGVENLAIVDMGHSSVRQGGASASSSTGMFEVPFTNNKNDTEYRYGRLRCVIAGTTPSITVQQAHIANPSFV